MFKPAAVFIGLRYTRAKRRNHFISFISMMSMIGIALGIIVLITVLSVMNGFHKQIKARVFSMVPPITITSIDNALPEWKQTAATVQQIKMVTGVAPFVEGQVLLTNGEQVQPALVNGILPDEERHISAIHEKIIAGHLDDLKPGSFGIVLGEELADRLGVAVGDKVTMITPEVSVSPAGVMPRFKRFTVIGLFRAGAGFGFDSLLAYVPLEDAQKLFLLGNSVTGIHVTMQDPYQANVLTQTIADLMPPTLRISNWTMQYGAYFEAVSLEKKMMFLILMLIIAVAAFNLVSTLVMVVSEKESDIAILRTMGATPRTIMSIFIVQGAVIGVVGTLLGIMGGVSLALHVTPIVNWIQNVFHVQFLSSGVYIVDYLPSELQWHDVFVVASFALVLSLLSTIYPAWRASRTNPVEALRYE